MRRLHYLADDSPIVTLCDALTATQDPLAGGAFGLVPAGWGASGVGHVPEFDLRAFAAGTVTLTNVELFAGVLRPGTIADDDFTATHGTETFTANAHGLLTGDGPVRVASSGALPAGLATATDYWIIRVNANDFKLAASFADALAGNAVAISDNGTGTHTLSDTADSKLVRWLSLGTVLASMALTVRRGHCVRVTGHARAFAYAVGATWGSAVAATFEACPVEERS